MMDKCECIEKLFCCDFSYGLLMGKLICCLFKFFVCFAIISDFVLVLLLLLEYVPGLKQLLNGVLLRNKVQSIWGSCKIFQRKWSVCWITLLKILPIVVFVMLTKCCIFAIKTESWLFVSKLYISSVSGEYRNFLREV